MDATFSTKAFVFKTKEVEDRRNKWATNRAETTTMEKVTITIVEDITPYKLEGGTSINFKS